MSKTAPQDQNASGRIQPGDRVLDRDQLDHPDAWQHLEDTPHTGVVIDVLDVPADQVRVEARDRTVAEDNPEYPPDDRVVQVVWARALDEVATLWAGFELDTLRELARQRDELTVYHFPASRLTTEGESA